MLKPWRVARILDENQDFDFSDWRQWSDARTEEEDLKTFLFGCGKRSVHIKQNHVIINPLTTPVSILSLLVDQS